MYKSIKDFHFLGYICFQARPVPLYIQLILFIITAFILIYINKTKVIFTFISLEILNFILLIFLLNYGNFYFIYIVVLVQVCESLLVILIFIISFSSWNKYIRFSILLLEFNVLAYIFVKNKVIVLFFL